MEPVSNSNNNVDNTVISELSKEFDINLMNRVIEVVKSNLPVFSKTELNSTTYYTELGSKLQCKISIELVYSDTKLEDNKLVLRWFDKRQNSMKFNYSESSIQRLLEQLEYLNVQLHITK